MGLHYKDVRADPALNSVFINQQQRAVRFYLYVASFTSLSLSVCLSDSLSLSLSLSLWNFVKVEVAVPDSPYRLWT